MGPGAPIGPEGPVAPWTKHRKSTSLFKTTFAGLLARQVNNEVKQVSLKQQEISNSTNQTNRLKIKKHVLFNFIYTLDPRAPVSPFWPISPEWPCKQKQKKMFTIL